MGIFLWCSLITLTQCMYSLNFFANKKSHKMYENLNPMKTNACTVVE